ncbi:hypothetical protein U2691_003745 [Salmonella enterica]|nr:hypothetical protein [Salmonella enterica subsp. enterica serovar Oranienburg]EDW1732232.1 hypothetical protein [Salmonella enterica subsp. enterica]ELP6229609.1 hypothetical protein [Salmonella enterica]ECA1474099.1 hypothetical protein [Salmonella enterica subsp. enterica serovar Oranienburg]ECA9000197.1 hypothetical protein [Salmonella enterica subsp. enterica serovar Oranienburg]
MSKGFSMFTGLFEENGNVPWHDRSNPQFAASRPLCGQEIAVVHDAVEADPVAVYCLLLPELWKRNIKIEASFSCVTSSGNSKSGHSFINNYGHVPRAIGKKAPHFGRTFTNEEHRLFDEMVASAPDQAISAGMRALQKKGLIISAWYLAADEN